MLLPLISCRKRPVDATTEFDSAMSNIFQILMSISRDFLNKYSSSAAGIDESEFEFVECICESMVALGSSHVQCISGDATIISQYLQLVKTLGINCSVHKILSPVTLYSCICLNIQLFLVFF